MKRNSREIFVRDFSSKSFCKYLIHRVIILNRRSMFAFQWREFPPPLSSAHRLLQCYHSQWEIGDAAIPGEFPLIPKPLGSLANERAVSNDVTLWVAHSGRENFHHFLPILLWRHALSSSIITQWSYLLSGQKIQFYTQGFKSLLYILFCIRIISVFKIIFSLAWIDYIFSHRVKGILLPLEHTYMR